MEIYLMRHGEAVSSSTWMEGDDTRPLSDKGKNLIEDAAKKMKEYKFKPAVILCSPFLRAKQTATLISEQIGGPPATISPSLASGARVSAIKSTISKYTDHPSILIVSHIPDLIHFASMLSSDPWLMEEGRMSPGEMWGYNVDTKKPNWGDSSVIWIRPLKDWSESNG